MKAYTFKGKPPFLKGFDHRFWNTHTVKISIDFTVK